MNRWLAEECKWAREQALKAQERAENLADPEWRRKRLAQIGKQTTALYEAIDLWLSLRNESDILEDEELRADEIATATRNAAYWTQLAEEQSARLASTEDTAALFEEQP